MILIIKITQCEWSCTVEIDDSTSLEDLHYFIQSAVEFDDDHLYEFFLSNSERSRNRDLISTYEDSGSVTLKEVFPVPAGKKLFYLFDYGDNWLFRIALTRKAPFSAVNGVKYSNQIQELGERPIQYPEWEE
jgi:hypothetical protein